MRYRLNDGHPWQRYEGADACDMFGRAAVEAPPSIRSPFAEPDLADAATLGALLGLVREAYNDRVVASIGCGWWEVDTDDVDGGSWDIHNTASYAEALVAALEAAPVRS